MASLSMLAQALIVLACLARAYGHCTFDGNVLIAESVLNGYKIRSVTSNTAAGSLKKLTAITNPSSATIFSSLVFESADGVNVRIINKLGATSVVATYVAYPDGSGAGVYAGRQYTATAANVVTFADGKPAPAPVNADPALVAIVAKLQAALKKRIANCNAVSSISANPGLRALAVGPSDPGHLSDPRTNAGCIACIASATATAAGAAATCCIATVAIGCPACAAIVYAAEVAALITCRRTACCPVTCGTGSIPACCDNGEACLNSATNLCCPPGYSTCVATSCCAPGSSCVGGTCQFPSPPSPTPSPCPGEGAGVEGEGEGSGCIPVG